MFILANGSSRYVIAIPALGIVFKFAKFHPIAALEYIWDVRSGILLPKYWEAISMWLYRTMGRAVADNWRERSYYKHSTFPQRLLLQPTHVTFFGLVNIQKYGKPINKRIRHLDHMILSQAAKIIGRGITRDGHHWENHHNFHLKDGHSSSWIMAARRPKTYWMSTP